jgi:diguanylate cyclase (GGDEF)-like protein
MEHTTVMTDVDSGRKLPGSRNVWLLTTLALLGVVIALSIAATVVVEVMAERETLANRLDRVAIRRLEAAHAEADAATLGYALTSDLKYYDDYVRDEQQVTIFAKAVMARVHTADGPALLDEVRGTRQIVAELVRANRPSDAVTALRTAQAHERTAAFKAFLEDHYDRIAAIDTAAEANADRLKSILRAITLGGVLVVAGLIVTIVRRVSAALRHGHAAGEQIEQLFAMGDMLQSAGDRDDTNQVLRATAARLLPGLNGALYVFNNSRDRLDLSVRWGQWPADHADHMAQANCWALKRGKSHTNGLGAGALRCAHSPEGVHTVDIPMMARGQLHGLLELACDTPDAEARLNAALPVATAIADALSLALSNAALRDQLRNQALRDGLTGLYNRRFFEEVRERLCLDATRRGSSLALIMIDLDRFKQLNDNHGHTAGDTVLREVAEVIVASVRGTDIVCRYGGEELLILLPDCPLAMAAEKAEQVRHRIAGQLFTGSLSVTASFGVATLPDTSTNAQTLLSDADAALYVAKTGGRNRVAMAEARAAPPLLAAA